MRWNTKTVLGVWLLVCVGILIDPVSAKADGLQIYLPRDITVQSAVPKLGQVAIIRGNDMMADQIDGIALGRISKPGQSVIIDRHQILSRLASYGIDASQVNLTGALKTTITQAHQVVTGEALMTKALAFVKANQKDASVCGYQPVRTAEEVIVPGEEQETTITVRPLKSSSRIQSGVMVSVFADGQKIAQQPVIFRSTFRCYRLVAQSDINPGEMITPDNVNIQPGVADYPEDMNRDGWIRAVLSSEGEPQVPAGLIARRPIPAETALQTGMAGPVNPPVLVKRRQSVVIRFEQLGLIVTAVGMAEQEGHLGDMIKVRNVDSKRTVMARINEDGSVSPIL